jgi:ribosome-associated heat shock protein Hsp15
MDKTRIDKWLWAVRIFKSRTLAADACKNGRVRLGGNLLKASSFVHKGDLISVKKDQFNLQFKVIEIIDKRVSAKLAEPCYENQTSSEELNKFKSWFMAARVHEYRDKGLGRPTKKDRREIDHYKLPEDENLNPSDDFFDFE